MAAQKGRGYLIKLNTTGNTFVEIGGMREPTFTMNNEPVDVTTSDDSGVRKLLEGAGVSSLSVKAQGLYVDNAYLDAIRAAAATNIHKNFQLVIPGTPGKTIQGSFMIASFEDSGSYNAAGGYSITLESAGAYTIT